MDAMRSHPIVLMIQEMTEEQIYIHTDTVVALPCIVHDVMQITQLIQIWVGLRAIK